MANQTNRTYHCRERSTDMTSEEGEKCDQIYQDSLCRLGGKCSVLEAEMQELDELKLKDAEIPSWESPIDILLDLLSSKDK